MKIYRAILGVLCVVLVSKCDESKENGNKRPSTNIDSHEAPAKTATVKKAYNNGGNQAVGSTPLDQTKDNETLQAKTISIPWCGPFLLIAVEQSTEDSTETEKSKNRIAKNTEEKKNRHNETEDQAYLHGKGTMEMCFSYRTVPKDTTKEKNKNEPHTETKNKSANNTEVNNPSPNATAVVPQQHQNSLDNQTSHVNDKEKQTNNGQNTTEPSRTHNKIIAASKKQQNENSTDQPKSAQKVHKGDEHSKPIPNQSTTNVEASLPKSYVAATVISSLVATSVVCYAAVLIFRRYFGNRCRRRIVLVNEDEFDEPNDIRQLSVSSFRPENHTTNL